MKTLTAIFVIFIFTALAGDAFGATKISARNGGFGLASTWTDNIAPVSGDDIIILAEHGVHGTSGRVVNNLTVRGSLTLSHPGLTVNGTLHVEPGGVINSLSGLLYINGDCVNDGTISSSSEINGEGHQSISGSGIWNGNGGEFNGNGTKTLSNVRMINGWWAVNSRVVVVGRWLMTKGRINKSVTGIVEGAGIVEFQDVGQFASNETTGNLWTVPIEITTGTRSAVNSSSISAPVTVRSGTTLSTHLNMTLNLKDDVFIETNAKLSGQTVQLSGVNILNNGEVFPTVLEFKRDGDQAISGGGAWRNSNGIYFRGSGTKSLLNDMTTSVGTVAVESTLNINEHVLTVKNGNFNKPVTGNIIGAGKISFEGTGNFYSHETNGNLFAAPVEIKNGTRAANSTSSFSAPVTVKSGATLSTHLRVKIHVRDDLTLEAGGVISGESLEIYDADFSNNGAVATVTSYFRGTTVLSGTTGSFGGNGTYIEPGASVLIVGVQQFRNLVVRSGGSLDISQNQIKISGVLSVAGTMTTDGSTIEFNSASAEQAVPTNIDYYNLTINNPREVNLNYAETVQNVLRLERGVFDIYINRLTIANCGQIVYVNGTLKGTPIYPDCVKIAFVGDTPRDSVQMPDVVHTLSVENTQPVRLIKNLTVTHTLGIFSDLETGDFILTMPAEAVSVGTADVVGNVRRTGILNEIAYSFGNPQNTIRFDTGVAPTEVSVKLTKSAPADLTRAVSRTYDISPVGGIQYSATLRLRYDDAELNGNDESMLHFFHSNGTWMPIVASSRDETGNWLEATDITSFSSWTLAEL